MHKAPETMSRARVVSTAMPDLDTAPPHPRLARALARAVRRRCPRCGGGHVFSRGIRLKEDCPTCGLHFERIDGYWLGSMVINLAVTQIVFLSVFIGLLVITWPDVPWTGVLVVVVTLAVVVPILFHPVSRMIWVAGERHLHIKPHPDATD